MALPAEVHDIKVKDSTEFDLNGTPMKIRVYTFWIGAHGPFTEKFYAGEMDTPAVERRIGIDVATLREQGLLATK
jgi:hypothetical protein